MCFQLICLFIDSRPVSGCWIRVEDIWNSEVLYDDAVILQDVFKYGTSLRSSNLNLVGIQFLAQEDFSLDCLPSAISLMVFLYDI